MSEPKTKPTNESVDTFISTVEDKQKQADSRDLRDLMSRVTGQPAKMWGPSIIGFGSYTYKYASGNTGEWAAMGFSPRKQNLTLYIMQGFDEYEALLDKLGPHSTSKACLYIKRLSDVDLDVLEQIIKKSWGHFEKLGFKLEFNK